MYLAVAEAEMMWHHALMATALARLGRPANQGCARLKASPEAREEAERAMDALFAHRSVFPVGRMLIWSFATIPMVQLVEFYADLIEGARAPRPPEGRDAANPVPPPSSGRIAAAAAASSSAASPPAKPAVPSQTAMLSLPTAATPSPALVPSTSNASHVPSALTLADAEARKVLSAGVPPHAADAQSESGESEASSARRSQRGARSGSLLTVLTAPGPLPANPSPVGERRRHSLGAGIRPRVSERGSVDAGSAGGRERGALRPRQHASRRRSAESRRRSTESGHESSAGDSNNEGGSRRGSFNSSRRGSRKRSSVVPIFPRDPAKVLDECIKVTQAAVPSNALLGPVCEWAKGRRLAAEAAGARTGCAQRRLRRSALERFRKGAAAARLLGLRPWEMSCLIQVGLLTDDAAERARCAELAAALAEDMDCTPAAVEAARRLRRSSAAASG
eukprot:tig00000459_g1063.t1